MAPRDRLPPRLLVVFLAWAVLLGVAPVDHGAWWLENALVIVALPWLALAWQRMALSRAAWLALFAFLLVHEVGAHYTYAQVPYDRVLRLLDADTPPFAPGDARNQFDRLVHFLYGLLVTPMAWEMLAQRTTPRGSWRWLLPLTFMLSHALVYEELEWAAAETFAGELGMAYLGTQGDPWDAQKDMALAALGSAVSVGWMAWRTRPGRG